VAIAEVIEATEVTPKMTGSETWFRVTTIKPPDTRNDFVNQPDELNGLSDVLQLHLHNPQSAALSSAGDSRFQPF
jgi:hypothetical protein